MKEKIFYSAIIIVLLWVAVSTLEVQMHNLDSNYVYNKGNLWVLISAHTTDMIVRDCQGVITDDFEVTVEDIEGNLYAYIDTEPREIGSVIRVTMSGSKIINAK
jgi:hypothetical protein